MNNNTRTELVVTISRLDLWGNEKAGFDCNGVLSTKRLVFKPDPSGFGLSKTANEVIERTAGIGGVPQFAMRG